MTRVPRAHARAGGARSRRRDGREALARRPVRAGRRVLVGVAWGALLWTAACDDGAEPLPRAPEAVASIPDQELAEIGESELNLLDYFEDPDGDTLTFGATTSDARTVAVAVSEGVLTVEGVAIGDATVTVTASDPDGLTTEQRFGVTVTPRTDRAALVAFYHATGEPDWGGWLTDAPLGEWWGVRTDSKGRVIGLDLRGHRFRGTLPPEIGNLPDLESLRLSGPWRGARQLDGPIPPEIGKLSKLRVLQLESLGVEGPIPPELGQLSGLRYLMLAYNRLAGPIPPGLGQLPNLFRLQLMRNELSGSIPPELGRLSTLLELDAHANELSGPIPAELGQLPNLRRLSLAWNHLSGPIPPELGELSQLEALQLRGNRLTDAVPKELGQLADLDSLDLCCNRLTGSIPPELGQLSSLTALDLGENELTGLIPPELGQLSSLTVFNLRENELTGSIPPELGALAELTGLHLQGNLLDGSLGGELGRLANLMVLNLGFNALSGSIPPELGALSHLEDLELGDNDLTGPIPAELSALSSLRSLTLSSNALTGAIPPELGSLALLQHLRLQDNALTGPIPPELGRLSLLSELRISRNRLSGSVPPEVGDLPLLEQLRLTENEAMSGPLPEGFTAMGALRVLLLGGTELCAPRDAGFEEWLKRLSRLRVARCGSPEPAAYVTQAVQSERFPVALVAGRKALLRVFVTATRATNEGIPPVRTSFWVDGVPTHVVDIPGKPVAIPTEVEEGDLSRSANLEIPAEVVRPGLEIVVEIDPEGTLDAGLLARKRIPEYGRMAVHVERVRILDLTLIPFLWDVSPDSSIIETIEAMAEAPRKHPLLRPTLTLLPVGDLDVTAHEPVVTNSTDPFDLLWETWVIERLEGPPAGHFMGMMSGLDEPRGMAYVARSSSFATPDSLVIAHELAHNWSLWHAPCGGAERLDRDYPHADGEIGAWGYDFRSGRLVPPGTPDLMSSCEPKWIGDYHFTNMLTHRQSDHLSPITGGIAESGRTILLWGGVDAHGDLFLDPAFVSSAPSALPRTGGEYEITGRTATGKELFSFSFPMPEVADAGGRSGFVFAVPARREWSGKLASVTLSGLGKSVTLARNDGPAAVILRDPLTGRVRGVLRHLSPEMADKAAALAPASGLEALVSRGIPTEADWRF